MAMYTNNNKNSPIASVEFTPTEQGNMSFFRLRADANADTARQFVTTQLGQQIVSETQIGKEAVLVTRGNKTQTELLTSLKERGDQLGIPQVKGKLNLWKARGWASMIGQPMQLLSGLLSGKKDWSIIGFAALNITANASNIVFGAQKEADVHQLNHLKTQINERLAPYLPQGSQVIDIHDNRSARRKTDEAPPSFGTKIWNFMKRNSVTVGEIGLRYAASVVLAFPLLKKAAGAEKASMQHWKEGFTHLTKGDFSSMYHSLKAEDPANLYAGLTYIAGKTVALTSKVPDPYNPKKPSLIDTIREKVVFRLSSVIETFAAATIALDRLNLVSIEPGKIRFAANTGKRTLKFDNVVNLFKNPPQWLKKFAGKETSRDWLGGIGGLLFTGGLIIRIFAPFGTKEVDMTELTAHASDSLAMVPADKLPQAVADTAAYITGHFKDKKLEFSTVYSQLTQDLEKFNNVSLGNAASGTEMASADKAASPEAGRAGFSSRPGLKKQDIVSMPRPGTFQDLATATAGTSVGLGA